jgi:hypothetical protein
MINVNISTKWCVSLVYNQQKLILRIVDVFLDNKSAVIRSLSEKMKDCG